MDGLARVTNLVGVHPMPMAELFGFELKSVERGKVFAVARPSAQHYNPFGVAQGGFASTVLDMALGLVSISVLESDTHTVSTTDLSVRYIRPIFADTGELQIEASILNAGRTLVLAQASLRNAEGKLFACAQCASIVGRERT